MKPPPKALIRNKPFIMYQTYVPETLKVSGDEELVLQSIHGYLVNNEKNRYSWHDGKVWFYKSLQDYNDQSFANWSRNKLYRVIDGLVKKGYIIKGNFNRMGNDRTTWYTIDYDKFYSDMGLEKDWEWRYPKGKKYNDETEASADVSAAGVTNADVQDVGYDYDRFTPY